MKNGYVIQHTTEWDTKDGRHIVHTSYYKTTKTVIFPFNEMVGNIDEAKFYDKKTLALHDLKRFFSGNREKIVSHKK